MPPHEQSANPAYQIKGGSVINNNASKYYAILKEAADFADHGELSEARASDLLSRLFQLSAGSPPRSPIAPTAARCRPIQDRPEWIDCQRVKYFFTISRSTIYRLASEGKIKTVSLRERGNIRGKRLFSYDSIVAFLNSRATGCENIIPSTDPVADSTLSPSS
jgi:hypothetical protein